MTSSLKILTNSPPCPPTLSWSVSVMRKASSLIAPTEVNFKLAYPGEPTIVTIVLVGYYGGTSIGTLQITPYNVKLASLHSLQLATPKCSNLKLMLQSSKVPSFGKVDIDVLGGFPDWQLSIIVRIKNCPPGFEIDHNSGECKCAHAAASKV